MKSQINQLSKISKLFHKKYKDIIQDIIVFGSLVKGKQKPNDVDILIIFTNKIDKDLEYKFKKQASKKIKNISITSKTSKNVYDESFVAKESMLFEGYSLINRKYIHDLYGFESLGMFLYQTTKLDNVTKTRFYYALNGRNGSKGMADSLNAIKLSANILAVPLSQIEPVNEFLSSWNIEYTYVPLLIPKRLAKKHIIGKVI